MSDFVCHNCELAMTNVHFRQWTISLCPRCEGSYSDEETLKQVLRQPDLRLSNIRAALLPNLVAAHPDETERSTIPCPACSKQMKRQSYAEDSEVNVDRCLDCNGIWLDDGELGHLLEDREERDPLAPPGFWEGLRRLLGRAPKLS